jgi:hypothetical protein
VELRNLRLRGLGSLGNSLAPVGNRHDRSVCEEDEGIGSYVLCAYMKACLISTGGLWIIVIGSKAEIGICPYKRHVIIYERVQEGGRSIASLEETKDGTPHTFSLAAMGLIYTQWITHTFRFVVHLQFLQTGPAMNSNTDESAADRLRRNAIVVKKILSNLSISDIRRSRYMSDEFNQEGREMIPRCIGQNECQARLRERLGPTADSDAVMTYSRPPTLRDLNVFAISIDPEQQSYTLPQTLMVYPNVETFYADGATVDRITDQFWITRSNMPRSAARTALVDNLAAGFFSDHALSHCPEVQRGSNLSLRHTHRLDRLKKKDDMEGSRYYRCTTVAPIQGIRYLLAEDAASLYATGAFGCLIDAHASHPWGPAHSFDTIEYAPREEYRDSFYRRLSRRQLPMTCHGTTTVILSSPDHAPSYFDLISNPTFPGDLRDMKHLIIDASLGSTPRPLPNNSQAYSSPHLQSVTFRLQDPTMDEVASEIASGTVEGAFDEETGEGHHLPGPQDLARPLYGSTARVVYTPGPSSAHLADLCNQATLSAASRRRGVGAEPR